MAQTYSIEFKEEACKRVQSGIPAAQVARELGINVNTLYTWMSRFKEHPAQPFVGSGNLHQEDAELRALKKRIKDLEEENEFLKKSKRLLCKEPEVIRYLYMEQHRSQYRIAKMAQWLQVSKSGYYAWRKRSKNRRCAENESLLKEIIRIHEESRGTYGTRKITHEINRK